MGGRSIKLFQFLKLTVGSKDSDLSFTFLGFFTIVPVLKQGEIIWNKQQLL